MTFKCVRKEGTWRNCWITFHFNISFKTSIQNCPILDHLFWPNVVSTVDQHPLSLPKKDSHFQNHDPDLHQSRVSYFSVRPWTKVIEKYHTRFFSEGVCEWQNIAMHRHKYIYDCHFRL